MRLELTRQILPCLLLAARLAAQDTLRVRVVATVGESSTPSVEFGDISGFAFDKDGRLYVTDFQKLRIVVLDQSGSQLACPSGGELGDHAGDRFACVVVDAKSGEEFVLLAAIRHVN